MKCQIALLLGSLTGALVSAQTVTTTDLAGNTIIEVITIDPALGTPSTTIIETIPAAGVTNIPTSLPTTTAPTTTIPDPVNQGPVGQPVPTQTGQTVYHYTTTDADGDTVVLTDTFTPTFPASSPIPPPTFTGSILSFTEWLSIVGSNTIPVTNAALERWRVPNAMWTIGAAVAAGAFGGAWLVVG